MRSWHEARCMSRSIVDSFGIPAVHVNVEVNPVKGVENFDIPLFAVPHRGPPPIARSAPRSPRGRNRAMHSMKCNPDGCAVAELDGSFQRRTEPAQGERLRVPLPMGEGGAKRRVRVISFTKS